ncbi:type II toxin-antitoxin system VapB family antitoxin [Streptomyces sp. MZ04]|uniref:type II toxin-antitoxin system VapB family antitoxin n=1 Tax=Streptomyces sp. MZ04 TaxID=2559236 RepID=UPI00107E8F9F|nr:type II toxin-antitoxin system VapB family antitoxin [Streptomyces sp. MZ04]TGA87266.1 type II toxin-antitoxin system VapB family antitoxin [Streptomyces sp. MZ04]
MARTVVDINDELLAEAAQILGTKSKVATVNGALEELIKLRKRETFAEWLKSGGLPDLTGPVDEPRPDGDSHRAA